MKGHFAVHLKVTEQYSWGKIPRGGNRTVENKAKIKRLL